VLLVLGAPRKHRLLVGREHGRTIPLPDELRPGLCLSWAAIRRDTGEVICGFSLFSPSARVRQADITVVSCDNQQRYGERGLSSALLSAQWAPPDRRHAATKWPADSLTPV
jgi:hypothetical protein